MYLERSAACAPAAPARGRGGYAPLRAGVAAAVCLSRRAASRPTPGAPVQSVRPYGGAPHATPKPLVAGIPTRGARGRATPSAPNPSINHIGARRRRPSTRPRASACCRSNCVPCRRSDFSRRRKRKLPSTSEKLAETAAVCALFRILVQNGVLASRKRRFGTAASRLAEIGRNIKKGQGGRAALRFASLPTGFSSQKIPRPKPIARFRGLTTP